MFYDDEKDERPSYSDPEFTIAGVKVASVFINRKHPSYVKSGKKGDLDRHIAKLIISEIIAMSYKESGEAIRLETKLYGLVASEL